METQSVKKAPKQKQTWDLKSKKFLAFIITANVGLAVFLFIIYKSTSYERNFEIFLDFLIWLYASYVGGNSIEKVATRIANKGQ